MRTTKSTSSTRMARLRAKQKLQKQFDELQAELAKIPLSRQHRTPQYRKLAKLWTKLNPDAPASEEKAQSCKISGSDATLRGVYFTNILSEGDVSVAALEAGRDVSSYGALNGAPVDQGPRPNCPSWLLDSRQRDRVSRRLVKEAIAKHPRARLAVSSRGINHYKLDREEKAITASSVDISMKLLHCYFVDRRELDEPLVLCCLPSNCFDQVQKGNTRPAQRYISKLVDSGYRLLGIPVPTEESREAARTEKLNRKNEVVERAQYGRGTDPRAFENEDEEGVIAKFKNVHHSDKELQREFSRLNAEDQTRTKSLPVVLYPKALLTGEGYLDLVKMRMSSELLRLSVLGRILAKLKAKRCDARKRR
jgi:hypothetical protein